MQVWTYNRFGEARQLSDSEVCMLPDFVIDTLEQGCLATFNGVLFGLSEAHLMGEDDL